MTEPGTDRVFLLSGYPVGRLCEKSAGSDILMKDEEEYSMVKIYVADTSVLIQAPYAIESFEDNQVVLPMVVLEELDHLKKSEGEAGANARRVIRYLEQLRFKGDLIRGVELENGGTLRRGEELCGCRAPGGSLGKR